MNTNALFCTLASTDIASIIRAAAQSVRYAGPGLRLELDAQRRNRGIHPSTGGIRPRDPQLPAPARLWGMDKEEYPGLYRRDALCAYGGGMRAPVSELLRRHDLRLSALLPAGLLEPVRNRRWSGSEAGRQNPGAAGLGAWHPERPWLAKAQGDAPAHL